MDDRKDAHHTGRKDNFTKEEVLLSNRNHGMHLEGLQYEVTPTGMHYLLIHFDIPSNITLRSSTPKRNLKK